MKRTARILNRITLTGILFLLLFAGSAYAAGSKALKAGCPSRCGETVMAREGRDGLILSLPGFWDLSAVTLEMEGKDVFFLGKDRTEIRAGQETDLSGLTGAKLPILDGKGQTAGFLTILQGSDIPALFLEVDGDGLKKVNRSKDNEVTEGRAVYTEADGTVAYSGKIEQLKGRGNNTFRYSKKPYQLKLGEKASLSGMGKGKTWILLADWTDVSLLRNRIVLDLSRDTGLRNAVGCVHADIWINGNYNGLYLVAEKIQIGKGRIDIANLEKETEKANTAPFAAGKIVTDKKAYPLMRSYPDISDPEDITGGYIMTIEKTARMKDYVLAGFKTEDGLNIRIKEPTFPSRGQAEYLYDRISRMQKALMSKDGTEPETGKSYGEYLDTESFARKYLIEEWCKNYDFFGGSQFLYKDSDLIDPLIYAGPAWDYDLSFGNMADRGYLPEGRYLAATRRNYNLYQLLYDHEPFRRRVGDLWKEVFRPAVAVLLGEKERNPEGTLYSIDEYREQIRASAEMNYRRWYVSTDATGSGSGGSFENAVRYLKRWIAARTEWMDGEYIPDRDK